MASDNISTFIAEHKYSRITEKEPDKEKFPLYYQASKHEYVIGPGEKLFIPAGWFHFVFSEDVDVNTGLNFAVNFWFWPKDGWFPGQPTRILPHKETHNYKDINPSELFKDKMTRVIKSKKGTNFFPSDRLFHHFKECSSEFMTFDDFYKTKNPRYYMIQCEEADLSHLTPKNDAILYKQACWINFGDVFSLLHYDEHDNWLYQIQGKKRVLLFPHEDRDLLYMFNSANMNVIHEVKNLVHDPCSLFCKFFKKIDENEWEKEIRDIYQNFVMNYQENILKPKFIRLPYYDLPTKYILHDTKGHCYDKLQKYPVTVFYILDGRGVLRISNKHVLKLNKYEIVIIPTTFICPWVIEGNLKFIVPE